ncbi:Hypothetical predicted protein, partial [Marmota monax]
MEEERTWKKKLHIPGGSREGTPTLTARPQTTVVMRDSKAQEVGKARAAPILRRQDLSARAKGLADLVWSGREERCFLIHVSELNNQGVRNELSTKISNKEDANIMKE